MTSTGRPGPRAGMLIVAACLLADSAVGGPAAGPIAELARSVVAVWPKAEFAWSGQATGVVIDAEGHILTSASRVYGAQDVDVCAPGAKPVRAHLVGIDRWTDVAVLELEEPFELPFVELRANETFALGEEITIVARPWSGSRHIYGKGIVSRLRSGSWMVHTYYYARPRPFQLHARYCQGFEGAPVVNDEGRVIGIALEHVPGHPVLATAKPLGPVLDAVHEILEIRGSVARGTLGHAISSLALGGPLRGPLKCIVTGVVQGGPAQAAGVREGDRALSIAGVPLDTRDALRRAQALYRAGQSIDIVIEGERGEITIPLVLAAVDRPPATRAACESQAWPPRPVMSPIESEGALSPWPWPSHGGEPPPGLEHAVLPGVVCIRSMRGGAPKSSGFCIDAEQHVVAVGGPLEGAERVVASTDAGGPVSLRLIAHDPWTDTAVFAVSGEGTLQPVPLLQERGVAVNEPLFVLGNVLPKAPFSLLAGLGPADKEAAAERRGDPLGIPRYRRIAAQFYPGCEGAPVLTRDGGVFGMVRTGYPDAEGVTWIEPMGDVLRTAREIIAGLGPFEPFGRPQVGLRFDPSIPVDEDWRAVIAKIEEGSPAEAAGMRPGDIVKSINEQQTTTPSSLWNAMCGLRANVVARLRVERHGEERQVGLTPEEGEASPG